ncbi:MAG TPA: Fe2+-dependent dioxygenase [Halieaceae bacterium]|nr:Fe2+-dependent dioxygenase [Halieaceae bacterium]|tara:strand:+ start:1914 stop:2594 length:681 start_codon:yes stop_codon:yes gene_type:complete
MLIIPGLLSREEVLHFRARLQTVPWLDGRSTALGMSADVKRNQQADAANATVRTLANTLLARYGETPTLVSAALPQRIFPPCFNRYGIGETYGLHVDGAIMRIPDTSDVMRSDVSMTLALSDTEEYDGGELVIATDFGEQRVRPRAGDAVVYPSSSLHQVTPITRGERLAAICWIQSLVADTQLRQTLFSLDQSIQSLIDVEGVPREQLDALHHVYHNLIRQFALV